MVYAFENSQLQQIRANFWKKQHKNNTHLNFKSDICEKTASSETFRLEIDLNFLENVNVLIVDQPPCYRSSIEDSIRLGVSNQHKTQALNYLRTKTISFCRKQDWTTQTK